MSIANQFYSNEYLQHIAEDEIWTEEFHREKEMASRILVKQGLVSNLATLAKLCIPAKAWGTKNYLITDSIVDDLLGNQVMKSLQSAGLEVYKMVVPAFSQDATGDCSCEKSKTMQTYTNLVDDILKTGITKNSTIISLGGGVVNNICGFVAGSLYRGIPLVHITTTMMGMVDAAIDFKQAVNHYLGKNLLGCYYPATVIIIDPSILKTQTARAVRNGLAESLKHGLCHSTELVDTILKGADKIHDADWLEEVIKMTISLKVPTLTHYHESDFNEMCPQYGHAVGHSCEFLSFHHGSTALLHGEGVAIGSCISAEIAYILGYCTEECVQRHYDIFRTSGLPIYVPQAMSVDMVTHQMLYDKHYASKRVTMGLLTDIGSMYHVDGTYTCVIEPEVLEAAILANIQRRDADPSVAKEVFETKSEEAHVHDQGEESDVQAHTKCDVFDTSSGSESEDVDGSGKKSPCCQPRSTSKDQMQSPGKMVGLANNTPYIMIGAASMYGVMLLSSFFSMQH